MFQNSLFPPLNSSSQQTSLFKQNAAINYHDNQWHNNELNNFNSYFSFFKPLLECFKFIYILKIIQLMQV